MVSNILARVTKGRSPKVVMDQTFIILRSRIRRDARFVRKILIGILTLIIIIIAPSTEHLISNNFNVGFRRKSVEVISIFQEE